MFCIDTEAYPSSAFAIYRNSGRARWRFRTAAGIPAVGTGAQHSGVAVADFDRDGRPDILAGRLGSLEIWRNLGGFRFGRATLPKLPTANFGPIGVLLHVCRATACRSGRWKRTESRWPMAVPAQGGTVRLLSDPGS